MPSPAQTTAPRAIWRGRAGGCVLELSGEWLRSSPPPQVEGDAPACPAERYDCAGLGAFDSSLPAFLLAHLRLTKSDKETTRPSTEGLPENLRALIHLALSVPEKSDARPDEPRRSVLHRLGGATLVAWHTLLSLINFTGQAVLSLGRFATGRARFRSRDFWLVLQDCGVDALPIVSLISLLIGLILAFVGNVQLAAFGANIFIADLVGIAMVREMGVMMTGIIMSGRTGASFAAHIGSMKANQEIDALRTFGFNEFDFLVLPRLLALVLMMPFLTIYSNVIGILGGMIVGASVGIPPVLYWNQTVVAITLNTAFLGVFKSVFFGAAIAMSGCLQGMQAGHSSAAVGQATTRAVVASITAVIVLDSAFAAVFTILKI